MDTVPNTIDQAAVRAYFAEQPGVTAVHHLHIWSLGADEIAMTAHLIRPDDTDHDAFIDRIGDELDHRFGINHPMLQIEHRDGSEHDRHDRAPHGHSSTSAHERPQGRHEVVDVAEFAGLKGSGAFAPA